MILILYHKIPVNVGISMILDTEKAHGLVRGLGLCLQSEEDMSDHIRLFEKGFSIKSIKKSSKAKASV